MSVNIKVTGGLNIEWGQIDPKATGGLKLVRNKMKLDKKKTSRFVFSEQIGFRRKKKEKRSLIQRLRSDDMIYTPVFPSDGNKGAEALTFFHRCHCRTLGTIGRKCRHSSRLLTPIRRDEVQIQHIVPLLKIFFIDNLRYWKGVWKK